MDHPGHPYGAGIEGISVGEFNSFAKGVVGGGTGGKNDGIINQNWQGADVYYWGAWDGIGNDFIAGFFYPDGFDILILGLNGFLDGIKNDEVQYSQIVSEKIFCHSGHLHVFIVDGIEGCYFGIGEFLGIGDCGGIGCMGIVESGFLQGVGGLESDQFSAYNKGCIIGWNEHESYCFG